MNPLEIPINVETFFNLQDFLHWKSYSGSNLSPIQTWPILPIIKLTDQKGATWNIQGGIFPNSSKLDSLCSDFCKYNADIYMLQETHHSGETQVVRKGGSFFLIGNHFPELIHYNVDEVIMDARFLLMIIYHSLYTPSLLFLIVFPLLYLILAILALVLHSLMFMLQLCIDTVISLTKLRHFMKT
jgi:hypothetical protein